MAGSGAFIQADEGSRPGREGEGTWTNRFA